MQNDSIPPGVGPKVSKRLLIIGVIVVIALVAGAIALARHDSASQKTSATQSMPTSKANTVSFKSTTYTDLKGIRYSFDFYNPYSTTKLKSGNNQLVAQATRSGKFPLALSVSSGEEAGYAQVKSCTGFRKVFDVQNSKLNQKIAVCDIAAGRQANGIDTSDTIYVAGFLQGGQAHIITITQDSSSIDTSSRQNAQKSAKRFGMKPYAADIKRIIASFNAEQETKTQEI